MDKEILKDDIAIVEAVIRCYERENRGHIQMGALKRLVELAKQVEEKEREWVK